MLSRTLVHTFVRISFVGALLLGPAPRLLAQDMPTPAGQVETDPGPSLPEFSEESTAAGAELADLDATAAEVAAPEIADELAEGPDLMQGPEQYEAEDIAELGDLSTGAGPEIDENGEKPASIEGSVRAFLPTVANGLPVAVDAQADEAEQATAADGGAAAAASQSVLGDFNGDGRDDLVTGEPYEDLVSLFINRANAGAVHVIYGSAVGLAPAGNQLWTQSSAGIADVVEAGDLFGWSVAVGDFNNNGFDDLAIGVPYEDLGAVLNTGAVHVLYGSAAGLTAAGSQFWSENSAGILGVSETGDIFGLALTTGDFNNDGRDDLAIGTPGEDLAAIADTGAAHILFGAAAGLTPAGNQLWNQNSAGILDLAEPGDQFGRSLASANFNGIGADDLAIGVPYEDIGGIVNAGAVNVLYGTAAGLGPVANQFWAENTAGILGVSEAGDSYGWSLAAGDFNGNGRDDLAVGIPYEDGGALANMGSANVIYGTAAGLNAAGNQLLHQDVAGVLEVAEAGDVFAIALNAGNFNGDARADLAVGISGEDLGAVANPGAVAVFYGAAAALTTAGNQFWSQNSAGVFDVVEPNDNFGLSLAVGDFNNNGFDDLVVGVPFEDLGAIANAGAVNVLYGPLGAGGNQFWWENSAGILGTAEANDNFGYVNQ